MHTCLRLIIWQARKREISDAMHAKPVPRITEQVHWRTRLLSKWWPKDTSSCSTLFFVVNFQSSLVTLKSLFSIFLASSSSRLCLSPFHQVATERQQHEGREWKEERNVVAENEAKKREEFRKEEEEVRTTKEDSCTKGGFFLLLFWKDEWRGERQVHVGELWCEKLIRSSPSPFSHESGCFGVWSCY